MENEKKKTNAMTYFAGSKFKHYQQGFRVKVTHHYSVKRKNDDYVLYDIAYLFNYDPTEKKWTHELVDEIPPYLSICCGAKDWDVPGSMRKRSKEKFETEASFYDQVHALLSSEKVPELSIVNLRENIYYPGVHFSVDVRDAERQLDLRIGVGENLAVQRVYVRESAHPNQKSKLTIKNPMDYPGVQSIREYLKNHSVYRLKFLLLS